MPRVPLSFALRTILRQNWQVFTQSRAKYVLFGGLGLGIWYGAYHCLTDSIDRSCSLVRQTLFNIKCRSDLSTVLGTSVVVVSPVRGKINQWKGHADVEFDIAGHRDRATVHVIARRVGADWRTTRLAVRSSDGAVRTII